MIALVFKKAMSYSNVCIVVNMPFTLEKENNHCMYCWLERFLNTTERGKFNWCCIDLFSPLNSYRTKVRCLLFTYPELLKSAGNQCWILTFTVRMIPATEHTCEVYYHIYLQPLVRMEVQFYDKQTHFLLKHQCKGGDKNIKVLQLDCCTEQPQCFCDFSQFCCTKTQ